MREPYHNTNGTTSAYVSDMMALLGAGTSVLVTFYGYDPTMQACMHIPLDKLEALIEQLKGALAYCRESVREEFCPTHGRWKLTEKDGSCPECDWPGHNLSDPSKCCKPGEGCQEKAPEAPGSTISPPVDSEESAATPEAGARQRDGEDVVLPAGTQWGRPCEVLEGSEPAKSLCEACWLNEATHENLDKALSCESCIPILDDRDWKLI